MSIILTGDFDCMDWSDELFRELGESCSFQSAAMECDEHLCLPDMYACGDGQCVDWVARMAFQRSLPLSDDCYNKRNLNYMCEVSPRRLAWTLEGGLCWPDKDYDDRRYPSWNLLNSSQLTDDEICDYLFRCVLSNNFEHDCPCHLYNCTQMMTRVCSPGNRLIPFPTPGLISANLFIHYNYTRYSKNANPDVLELGGSIRCRGYHFSLHQPCKYTWKLQSG